MMLFNGSALMNDGHLNTSLSLKLTRPKIEGSLSPASASDFVLPCNLLMPL